MNELEGLEYNNICMQCNQKVINYPNQLCRRQFLSSSRINEYSEIRSVQFNDKTSGNFKLDEFINETQLNSKYCDDYIEWIPRSNLENVKYLTNGGNSKVYFGTWNLMLNMSLASIVSNQLSFKVALKAINDSDNINDHILNELKIHHQCRDPRVVPFYGITKAPKGNEYAMVIRHAKHGDLRNYICKFFPKLTWTDRVKILIELSKALNSIHRMNLLHKDFHCKNILVDEGDRIFISDFGLCQPIDSEIASDRIQGVLPYIAPEVLTCKPYTKQSEVYSLSMIMWELASKKPPFSNSYNHDIGLALAILDGLRPEIVEGTPDFYADFMRQCWNSNPLERPDASLLPKLFEEILELCKMADNNAILSKVQSSFVTNNSDKPGYDTRAFDLSLNMGPTSYSNKGKAIMINMNNSVDDMELSPQSATNSYENRFQPNYETKAYEYTLKVPLVQQQQFPTIATTSMSDNVPMDMCSIPQFEPSKKRLSDDINDFDDDNNKKQKTGGNDNNNRYNEKEDPRYITQTYKFSLYTLNEVYNDLINNRSRLLDISSYNYFAKFRI